MAQLRTEKRDAGRDVRARRRAIASYTDYRDAERAVDWLSDQGFAVERGAIIGTGLRSVEPFQAHDRMARRPGRGGRGRSSGRSSRSCSVSSSADRTSELLLFSLAVGAFFGGITGAIIQAASGEGATARRR